MLDHPSQEVTDMFLLLCQREIPGQANDNGIALEERSGVAVFGTFDAIRAVLGIHEREV
jgi:hypothetical protein